MKYQITIYGMVQGVGFRPFVAETAEKLNIAGTVRNSGGIVKINLECSKERLEEFLDQIKTRAPYGSRIDSLEVEESLANVTPAEFKIITSDRFSEDIRLLPPDLPTCDRCRRELLDPKNRRFRYPFISCTICGPRFSIQHEVPYDRDTIVMDEFPMCEDCKAEYEAQGNIRRHAQTIACDKCGPKVELWMLLDGITKVAEKDDAVRQAIKLLKSGKIGAIKDIGGYHFAFDPYKSEAARRLREFKARERKPFAVMFPSIDAIKEMCHVSEKEEEILLSDARPIVLLKKKDDKEFAEGVCDRSDRVGAMLPCNPLQILILEETGPLVMTSGNLGGAPIIIRNEEMYELMKKGVPDFTLSHNRKILTPLDDSIYQVTGDIVQMIRRARGLVPNPIFIKEPLPREAFAAGGDLKSVFAIGKKKAVYLSEHFGDLDNLDSSEARDRAIKHMETLLDVHPKAYVIDKHPGYVSSNEVHQAEKVQHHHTHIASVLAEYGIEEKTLGLAFDGTGYGDDGTIWGSEFLICQGAEMKRVASLMPVVLAGGDAGSKDAGLTLDCYLVDALKKKYIDEEEIDWLKEQKILNPLAFEIHKKQIEMGINTAKSSSMGRLFDAVAKLVGAADRNSYEGECPAMLEKLAQEAWIWSEDLYSKFQINKETFVPNPELEFGNMKGEETSNLGNIKFTNIESSLSSDRLKVKVIEEDGILRVDASRMLADLIDFLRRNKDSETAAGLFHLWVCDMILAVSKHILEAEKLGTIALAGGTFYNRILLQNLVPTFQKSGIHVYINSKVPSGDGGLALGQMWLLGQMDKNPGRHD